VIGKRVIALIGDTVGSVSGGEATTVGIETEEGGATATGHVKGEEIEAVIDQGAGAAETGGGGRSAIEKEIEIEGGGTDPDLVKEEGNETAVDATVAMTADRALLSRSRFQCASLAVTTTYFFPFAHTW